MEIDRRIEKEDESSQDNIFPESKANAFLEFKQSSEIAKFHDQNDWNEKYKIALSIKEPRANFILKRLIFDESPKTLSVEDFKMAKERGVNRLLCNHPTYIIGASLSDITELVNMGAYVEHSMCMFVQTSKYKFYEPNELDNMIKAAGIDKTILGSDLGQVGNPSPVDGFRGVINMCLDLGYDEISIHKLVSQNASKLIGI